MVLAAALVGVVPILVGATPAFAASAIVVSPTTVDFGNVIVGQQPQQQVTVTNTTTAPQFLTDIALPAPGSPIRVDGTQCLQFITLGQSLPPGGSCAIPITFQPTATGTFTTSFSISGGSPSTTQTVSITGTGVPLQPPTTQITSSANPSAPGQSISFAATVTGVSGSPPPTGTVQFAVDGANLGGPVAVSPVTGSTGPPQAGATSTDLSSLSLGAHTVTASYSGDSAYQPTVSTFTQTVDVVNVSSLNPTAGPTEGGTPVTITGFGFAAATATAVSFGGVPATFTVVSDTEITATSPGGQNVEDVIVTTAAGQSAATPADQFTYPTFCVPGTYNVCAQGVDATEGAPFTALIATFSTSDVNAQPADFSTQISWGDGTVDTGVVVANPDGSFNLIGTHTFGEEGCCEEVNLIHISVQDLTRDRATVQTQSAPNIADAPLSAAGVPVNPVLNTAFQGPVATFSDADPGRTATDYTATIDWGDRSPLDQGTITAQGNGFAVTGSHTYTGTTLSTITVQITDAGGATASTTVTTNLANLDHLVISPGTQTITAGGSQTYAAEGFDASGHDLGDVTAATTFTISPDGTCTGATCTPTDPGAHTVTGTDGAASGTATLNLVVAPVLSSNPNPSQFGQAVTFTATLPGGITPPGAAYVSFHFPAGAFDSSGTNVVAPISNPVTAFTTGSNTILQPGSWAVTANFVAADQATQIGPTSNTVTEVVEPPPLDHLVLSPADAGVDAGASHAYTAEGFAARGQDLGNLTSATSFTISPDGSCSGATCTPARPGPHTVTGRDGSATGTATLNVAVAHADMSIAVVAPASAQSGATFTYDLVVTNHGPDPATNVQAKLAILGGASTLVSSPGATVSGSALSWSAGSVLAGRSTSYQVTVLVDAPRGGLLLALGADYSSAADPDPFNNAAATTTRVR